MKTHTFLKTALVAGLLAISGSSFAVSSTVTTTFTGTVPNTCSMATGAVGLMTIMPSNILISTSGPNGGHSGSFTLTCTGTANMAIAAPVPNAGTIALTNAASLTKIATLTDSTGLDVVNSNGTISNNPTSRSSGTYTVGMYFLSATPLAPGDYSSSVVTTITPN